MPSCSLKLFLASTNQGKIEEFRRLLSRRGIELLSMKEIGKQLAVEESAPDFAGNAALKARSGWELSGFPSLADDSGLVVDALDGRPGVLSARYGGPSLSNMDRCRLLLEEMKNIPPERRGARFVSVLAFCSAQGEISLFEGRVEGYILADMRGRGGFGYDSLFFFPQLQRSFAELTPEEKDSCSHRRQAIETFLRACYLPAPSL